MNSLEFKEINKIIFKGYMDNEEKDYLDNIKNQKILLNPKKWYIIKTRCDESEE